MDVRGFLVFLDIVRLDSMDCGKTRIRAPSWTRLCTKDALSMPCRYFPRPMRRECCCISCSPASLASREPCRMDCARAADTVSALYVARGEAGTWNEIARRTLGTAFRGRLKAKRVSMLACVGSREYRSCGRLREKVETTLNFKFGFPVPSRFLFRQVRGRHCMYTWFQT
jgi:hypothetical protein